MCFTLPSLMKTGVVLVVSPLIGELGLGNNPEDAVHASITLLHPCRHAKGAGNKRLMTIALVTAIAKSTPCCIT